MLQKGQSATLLSLAIICLALPGLSQIQGDEERADYEGHKLIRVTPEHRDHLKLLHQIHKRSTGNVDFWVEPTAPKKAVDIRVSPDAMENVASTLSQTGLTHDVIVDNIGSLIEDEKQHHDISRRSVSEQASGFNFSVYHTYTEILNWLDQIARECGDNCGMFNIGRSFEDRDMRVIRIGDLRRDKPVIWIDAGIHAREWIAPATALYIINKLVEGARSQDPSVRRLLDNYTWYILPMANPDGYAYTWSNDRLWRKTRSTHTRIRCRGADPNRNFDFHWGGLGTSTYPCSENFRGSSPFSEPEARAMRDFLHSLGRRLLVYLSLHSYGQYWLTPWGFTHRLPQDYQDMLRLGNEAAQAIRSNHGSQYQVGSSSHLLYPAAGASDDYAKGVLGVKYSYTVELRDTGTHGFILPAEHIIPTGEEMWAGLRTLGTAVLRERRALNIRRRQSRLS